MYQIESVVNKRINPKSKKPQYEVKWVGFHDSQNSWQPQDNLVFVKHLIERFNKNHSKRQGPNSALTQLKKKLNNPAPPKLANNIYKFKQTDNYNETSSDEDDIKFDKFQEKIRNYEKKPQKSADYEKFLREKQLQEMEKAKKKKLPPLPPDYSTNKEKYIDTFQSEKKKQNQKPSSFKPKKSQIESEKLQNKFVQNFVNKQEPDPFFRIDEEVHEPQEQFSLFDLNTEKQVLDESYKVQRILTMDKTDEKFYYLTQTTKGRLWLERKELYPKYSDILCLFYESYLTFT